MAYPNADSFPSQPRTGDLALLRRQSAARVRQAPGRAHRRAVYAAGKYRPFLEGTSMSTTPVAIRLTEPAEAISVVPYLLGFHPNDSLAILAMRRSRVVTAARLDLPADPHDLHPFTDAVRRLAGHLTATAVDAAVFIGYGSAGPVTLAIDIAAQTLTSAGITVRDTLRVADGRWWNLQCANPTCCPPRGTPFDPTTSVAAATATVAGLVALPNRDAIDEQLTPISGPARHAVAAASDAAVTRILRLADLATPEPGNPTADDDAWLTTPTGQAMTTAAQQLVTEALDAYRHGHTLDDERAATLTVVLAIPAVRDAAIRLSTGDDWQIRIWTDLVRRAEPPFLPGPAVLLAVCALQAGNGPLADCAARRALHADPDHRLAQLLLQLVGTGMDPLSMTRLVADS